MEIDKKQALEKFKIYEQGVLRLKELEKELNSLNTSKYKKQEKEIRKKLKNVSLIPEIESNILNLKNKIEGFTGENKVIESKKDKYQDNKIRELNSKERILESEILKDSEELSSFNRKSSFIHRLFNKEKQDINSLKEKVDKNRLDFNKKLLLEVAESKRMIEEEKFELRKQLLEVLAQSIREINKEKEESDKKLLAQINMLAEKIDSDKKNINNNVNYKLLKIKHDLEDSKIDLEKKTERQIKDFQKRIELLKKNPSKLDETSKETIKPAVAVPELIENRSEKKSFFSFFKRKLPENKIEEKKSEFANLPSNVESRPVFNMDDLKKLKPVKILPLKNYKNTSSSKDKINFTSESSLPEFPEIKEKPLDFTFSSLNLKNIEPRYSGNNKSLIETSKEIFPASRPELPSFPVQSEAEITLKEMKKPIIQLHETVFEVKKPKKQYIPGKTYLEYSEFRWLVDGINSLGQDLALKQEEVSKNLDLKAHTDHQINRCLESMEKIKENLAKIHKDMPLKG